MATVVESEKKIKKIVKAAILELLQERRDMVTKMLEEAFSDSPLFAAIMADGGGGGAVAKALGVTKKKPSSKKKPASRTRKPAKKAPSAQKPKPRSKPAKKRTR